MLCQDIVELRRGDHSAERLRLGFERFADAPKADERHALEVVIAQIKQWPEMRKAFQDDSKLYRQMKNGDAVNGQPTADRNPTGSK